jgi:acyl-CoA synthetase (AMP-forming)/AMP-acid ligase II
MDLELDMERTTLPRLVAWAGTNHGDIEGVVDTQDGDHPVRLTFAELVAEVDETAAALVAGGLQPGDRVGLWAPNTWEWVVAALATFRAGGVLVPVNTRFKGREAAYVLQRSGAKVLFTTAGFLGADYVGMLRGAGEALPALSEIVLLRGETAGATACADLLARATDAARAEVPVRSAAAGPDDLGLIMFTSGTTGLPKGVLIEQGPVVRIGRMLGAMMGVERGERYLVINPFFHAFGFNCGILPCLVFGATIVPHAVFEPTVVLEKVEAERINVLPGPPAIFQALLNHPDLGRFDLSSLRRCITGAATIPEETVVGMRERLGFHNVVTAYGMTETTGLATICRPGDDAHTVATTSGCAIPDVELRVVDDDGVDVDQGTPGELWVRGYQITRGYLDDPEQTAATITPDGWLRTGDVVVMDERGYIDITDRKKDMFIVGGFNAYPAEIERMMIEHADVGAVAVIGVADDRLGEVGMAYVIPAAGRVPDADELVAWCRERMANYKVPRRVFVVSDLPLNASGKVTKADLRADAVSRLAASG